MITGEPQVRLRDITLAGRRVRYREAGAGAAVLVASGLGLSGRFYDRNLRAFAQSGLRLIVPDLPGFGGTRQGGTGLDVAATSAFLLDFADAIGLERAVWIGHSIGAQAAIDVAVRAPHRVRGLVLVGPTGEQGGHVLARQLWALTREALRAPPAVVLHVLAEYARTSPLAYVGTWLRYAREGPGPDLARVQCPTLVLAGTRDPVVRLDYLELLLRRVPDVRLERVAGGTHALPRAHANEFNQHVVGFCRSLPAS